ncbi:hypothetical protein C5O00_12815 [Pukyongia salina]|uniref:Uncharacterized protein n=1 Tax=Pukyongia salina TaxID=2094025 RepID=A0A2S0HZ84_9FLAO|nr:tetratricopeptide repeat protein [Pukyongia salina]AVI51987.1 hypothetical protein C5O00_12815 [Pukyongia salina]
MKKLLFLLMGFLMFQATAQSKFTAKQWQEDLKFLQQTVHNDYSFLFRKTSAEEFDNAVKTLHDQIPTLQEHEISVGLARIIGLFKYGHTRMGWRNNPVSLRQFPVNLYHFSDGIYVQGVHKDYANALGAKVISVGGMPVMQALEKIYPVVPSENDQFFKAYGLLYLMSPEVLHAQRVVPTLSDNIELTLEKNGKTFTTTLKAMAAGEWAPRTYGFVQSEGEWLDAREAGETPLYLKNLDKIYYFEHLPEKNTVYVRHSQIQDDPSESIPEFYTRVFDFIAKNEVENLVLDVRLNGGGNNYKNKAVVTRIIESQKINTTGNLKVIIGRRTFSACQNLVNELDNYTNAVFIGEPTSENINFYGDNNEIILPNTKTPVYLSFAWWQDKPQWENGDWLAPHVAVEMSFEDYRTNQDPVLKAALDFGDGDFVTDPMQYMTNLYHAGDNEKLVTEVSKMVKDPRYKFFNFEAELNSVGYAQIGRGDHQTAIAIFSFVTQLFPDSANAWDSLAEGYLEAGDKEKAKEYYEKAYKMDPDGPTGKNATSMLRKIASH